MTLGHWRYYVSRAILTGCQADAGRGARPAPRPLARRQELQSWIWTLFAPADGDHLTALQALAGPAIEKGRTRHIEVKPEVVTNLDLGVSGDLDRRRLPGKRRP